jgi:hypothetical protein
MTQKSLSGWVEKILILIVIIIGIAERIKKPKWGLPKT